MFTRIAASSILLALTGVATSSARQLPETGARIRVVDGSGRPLATGSFVRLAGDTVLLDTAGIVRPVPLGPGRYWEASTGMHTRTLRGAGIGLAVGFAFGALIGAVSYSDPCAGAQTLCFDIGGPALHALGSGVVVGGVGAFIGAVAGSPKRETWRRISAREPRLTLAPAGTGIRIGIGLAL